MIALSSVEKSQLGSQVGDIPFVKNQKDWENFREWLVEKSAKRNPGFFDPQLSAYTPGETQALLQTPQISSWLEKVPHFEVPDCIGIVLVPCAASKPWRDHANMKKSKLYSAYNRLMDQMQNGERSRWFFVTVSEPLGLVPENLWNSFPAYDNPGLFRDDFLRTGLVKSAWVQTPLKKKHRLPFDPQAYQTCIDTLGSCIGDFLVRQSKPVISFVDDTIPTTHGDMLDVAIGKYGVCVDRHMKRKVARIDPYDYLSSTLMEAERVLTAQGNPSRKIKI